MNSMMSGGVSWAKSLQEPFGHLRGLMFSGGSVAAGLWWGSLDCGAKSAGSEGVLFSGALGYFSV